MLQNVRERLCQHLILGWYYYRERKGVLPAAVQELRYGNRMIQRQTISVEEQTGLKQIADTFNKVAGLVDDLRETVKTFSTRSGAHLPIHSYALHLGVDFMDLDLPPQLADFAENAHKLAALFSDLARPEGKRPRKRPKQEEDHKLLHWWKRMGWVQRKDLCIPELAKKIVGVLRHGGQIPAGLADVASASAKWRKHFRNLDQSETRNRRPSCTQSG